MVTFRICGELNTQGWRQKKERAYYLSGRGGFWLQGLQYILRFFFPSSYFSLEEYKKNSPDKLRGKMTGFPLWFVSLTSASSLILLLGRLSTPSKHGPAQLVIFSFFFFFQRIADTTEWRTLNKRRISLLHGALTPAKGKKWIQHSIAGILYTCRWRCNYSSSLHITCSDVVVGFVLSFIFLFSSTILWMRAHPVPFGVVKADHTFFFF